MMKRMPRKTLCPVMHSRTACNGIGLWTVACKKLCLLYHVL